MTEPLDIHIRWLGPFQYRDALYVIDSGLYFVFVGQHPIYLNGDVDVNRMLSSHLSATHGAVHPTDMMGRELLAYSQRYKQRLTVKVGAVTRPQSPKTPIKNPDLLIDVVCAIASVFPLPCNPYERGPYRGLHPLRITNFGKHHPLAATIEVAPEEPS